MSAPRSTNAAERSRTTSWADPLATAAAGRKLDGLGFLRAVMKGDIPPPPIASTIGMSLVDVGEGLAVFTMDSGEHQYNPIGMVHGGVVSTLLDSAMGCAVQSLLPQGKAFTTLELKVNFVRPVGLASGTLRCEGRVLHNGSRVATAEGKVLDSAGKLCAHATTTCMIMDVG